jgi:hypothetical protein
MELLIPGLLLVALMVWASTKIKKHAADAFKTEFIDTENYSLQKPDGFLHVIGDKDHELRAYSKEFGTDDKNGIRQATIEMDVFAAGDLRSVRDSVRKAAAKSELTGQSSDVVQLNTEESANETTVSAFYKIVAAGNRVYRLRFAVLPEYLESHRSRIEETFDSFIIKTN